MKQRTFSLFLGSTLATALSLSGCGNPNNTSAPTPNTGNIPQLATRPTPQSSPLRKLRFSGHIFDASTGEAIDQVQVWIQAVSEPATNTPASPMASPPPLSPPPTTTLTPAPPMASPAQPAGTVPPNLPMQPPASAQPPVPGPIPSLPPVPGLPLSRGPRTGFLLGWGAQALTPPVNSSAQPEQTLFRTSTNNQGKFWLNDLPEGQYTVTFQAPRYRTLTLTQIAAGTPLEIPLTPLNAQNTTAMAGMVLSPAENPVAGAQVSLAGLPGESGPLPTQTNALGEFLLEEIPYGKHLVSALVINDDFVIQQIGLSEEIPITNKSVKSRKPALPSAEPSAVKMPSDPRSATEKREALENSVENMLKESPRPDTSTADITPDSASASVAPVEGSPSPSPVAGSPLPGPENSAPNRPPEKAEEEEEQAKTEKPFNLFSAVSELVTGQKSPENETVKDGSIYPVIALRSVLSDFRLSGKVNLPEGYDYRGLDVWMSLKSAKDEPPREVFLFNLPARPTKPAAVEPEVSASPGAKVPPKSPPGTKPAAPASREPETAEFSLRLPTLEKGQSYHFQFTAAARQTGSLLYQHSYEIGEKNQKPLEISFLAAPTGIEVEGEEENAISTKPEFAWQPVTGAEYYRVLLEAGTPPENKVIWEAWTKTPRIAYPLESSTGQLKEQEVYTLSVAAIKGLKPVFKNSKTLYAHPGYQAIWTELSSLTHQPFEVVKPES